MLFKFFGQYLVNDGTISASQLTEAIELQMKHNEEIGITAVKKNMLTIKQVQEIIRTQCQKDLDFGVAAQELGHLTEEQVIQLTESQRSKHIYLGDALVKLGHLSQENKDRALKKFQQDLKLQEIERENSYPDSLEFMRSHINTFISIIVTIFQHMGGIVVKYSSCIMKENDIELEPYSLEMEFKGKFSNTISRFILMAKNEVTKRIASKVISRAGLKDNNSYSITLNDESIDDINKELINIICSRAFYKLSREEDFIGTIPENININKEENKKYLLKKNEITALIRLNTLYGPFTIVVVVLSE